MPRDIDFDELSSNKDQYVIYDVRNPEEVEATGHIPGAHNLPVGELETALNMDEQSFHDKYGFEKPKKDHTCVTHCLKGGRARKAGNIFADHGFSVRVYAGSFEDWQANNGDVVPGKPE